MSGKTIENICPAAPGAKDWQPTAWSPRTKLLYVPHQHLCMNFKTSRSRLHRRHALRRRRRSTCMPVPAAIAASSWRGTRSQRKKVWEIHEKFPVWSGALVTAGDVAFYGTMDRLVQSGGRQGRARCSGSSVPAPGSSASRSPTGAPTAAIYRHPVGRRRLAGRGRQRRGRSARAQRRARVRRRDAGPAGLHRRRQRAAGVRARRSHGARERPRRTAAGSHAPADSSDRRAWGCSWPPSSPLAASCAQRRGRASRLCRSQQSAVLQSTRARIREQARGDGRRAARQAGRPTPGGRSAAASSAIR